MCVYVWLIKYKRCGEGTRDFNPFLAYFCIPNALSFVGARGGVVVKALRHKPAGRGFDSRWFHWNFSVT